MRQLDILRFFCNFLGIQVQQEAHNVISLHESHRSQSSESETEIL